MRKITQAPGMHAVTLDHARQRFVDVHSAPDAPYTITLRQLDDGALIRTIFETADPRIAAFGLEPPELTEFQNRDGDTLYAILYRPPAEFGPGPYPTIISVYGGPHAQLATKHWRVTADMRAQYLRSLGFLVVRIDNRGSARRGLAFEGALKHDMGNVEVQDQVDGVRWLVAQGLADPARVGIYGWSYGGYMAAMCLARAPETFKVAVAGAPVTHWDGYDTHYTERYMGTPQSNPEGYAVSSVMAHVDSHPRETAARPRPHRRKRPLPPHRAADQRPHPRAQALRPAPLPRRAPLAPPPGGSRVYGRADSRFLCGEFVVLTSCGRSPVPRHITYHQNKHAECNALRRFSVD